MPPICRGWNIRTMFQLRNRRMARTFQWETTLPRLSRGNRMTFNRSLFSSAKGTWETPDEIYRALDQEFGFTMDATSLKNGFDAFKDIWSKRVYLNPPYGPDLYWWMKRGNEVFQ